MLNNIMPKQRANSHDAFDFAHHAAFVRRNRAIRGMILDYALGVAIAGFNPIPNTLWLTLLIVIVLLIKMSWDVGKKWHFPTVYDPLAYVGLLFGGIGAIAFTTLTFLAMLLLGQIFPLLSVFTLSAVLFTSTWSWGQTLHHFFSNGFPKRTKHRPTPASPPSQDMK